MRVKIDLRKGSGTDEKMDKESQNKSEAFCPSKLELAEVRDQLARAKSGPQYWRSLEELSQTEGFFEMVHREFPRQASVWPEGASRRDFMKLMTASMALAGLSASSPRSRGAAALASSVCPSNE